MTLSREQGVKRRRQSDSNLTEPPAKMSAVNVVERQSLWNVSLKKLQVCQGLGTERCLRKTVLVYNTLKVIHATFTGDCNEETTAVKTNNGTVQTSSLLESSGSVVIAGQLVSDEPEPVEHTLELDVYGGSDKDYITVSDDGFGEDDEFLDEDGRNKETGSPPVCDADSEGRVKRCPVMTQEGNQSKRVCVVEEGTRETVQEDADHADGAREKRLDLLSSCMMQCRLQAGSNCFRGSHGCCTGLEGTHCFVDSEATLNSTIASVFGDDVNDCGLSHDDVSALLGCANLSQVSSCAMEASSPAGSDHARLIEIRDN